MTAATTKSAHAATAGAVKVIAAVRVAAFGPPSVLAVGTRELSAGSISSSSTPFVYTIQIRAFGVNPSETYQRQGAYAVLPKLPYTPGKDAAGVVVAVNVNTSTSGTTSEPQFAVGQRVFVTSSLSGTYAEYCLCEERDVFPLPAALSFQQGAGFGVPYYAAWRAVVEKGELHVDAEAVDVEGHERDERQLSVLLSGASGAVGLLILQLLSHCREVTHIVATVGSERGRKAVAEVVEKWFFGNNSRSEQGGKKEKVKVEIVPHDHDFDGREQEEKSLGQQQKTSTFDRVIEMQAQKHLNDHLKLLKKNAIVIIVGNKGNTETSINPRLLMQSEAKITGFVGIGDLDGDLKRRADADLRRYVGAETTRLAPVIDEEKTFTGLGGAAEAHAEIEGRGGGGAAGRIVVQIAASGAGLRDTGEKSDATAEKELWRCGRNGANAYC
eukprot:g18723.t1